MTDITSQIILDENKQKIFTFRICNQCSTTVDKDNGCNYVKCNCGNEFCWICGLSKGNEEGKCKWNNIEHNSH